jgi:hypothetical protein
MPKHQKEWIDTTALNQFVKIFGAVNVDEEIVNLSWI